MITYDRICLMCPTYKRSKTSLPVFVNTAISRASNNNNICFSFVVNHEDKDTLDYLAERFKDEEVEYEILIECQETPHLAKFFNQAYRESRFSAESTLVSMVGDDMEFVTYSYDRAILRKTNDICGIGIVYCEDRIQHEALCVNMFVARRTVELFDGPFMAEEFFVDCIDNVWMRFAQQIGSVHFLKNIVIRHNHATINPVGKDETWKRNRAQVRKMPNKREMVETIASENARQAKLIIKAMLDPSIAFIMATYDRLPLLRITIESYNKSVLLPESIDVYDDGSREIDEVSHEVSQMRNAVFHTSSKHNNCPDHMSKVVYDVVRRRGVKAIFVIDSDTLFYPLWLIKLMDLWNELKNTKGLGAITLFDTPSHKKVIETEHYSLKKTVGGFGILYTRKILNKAFGHDCDRKPGFSWDNHVNKQFRYGLFYPYASSCSYLQHLGYYWGRNSNPRHSTDIYMGDYAPNFLGTDLNPEDVCKPMASAQPHLIGQPGDVCWASFARLGDIVMSSMIANQLIAQGIRLTWVTIPIYHDLINWICPNAKVKIQEPLAEGRLGEWSETVTDNMVSTYPGFDCYINAQLGARENHDLFMDSGDSPWQWLRKKTEHITRLKLSNKYTQFLRFDGRKYHGVDILEPDRQLAIIADGAITSKCLTPKRIDEVVKNLKAKGYETRILVKDRPENIPFQQFRRRYIWSLTVPEIVQLLRECNLFVGQDSGITWLSLYSECKKIIHHDSKRFERVNTDFSSLDNNIEQIFH